MSEDKAGLIITVVDGLSIDTKWWNIFDKACLLCLNLV